ncbi:MAG: leucine-rich repeat domain-containing protein, partial [Clostridia bacterium]|nr:leucine-rich repeat domain-containing protein [Clostridia bacterium]
MKTLKKALACMMVVVMLISAVPLSGFVGLEWPELNFGNIFSKIAAAADIVDSGTCGTNGSGCNQIHITWKLDSDGVLTISGPGAMTEYTDCYDVPWFSSHRDSIKNVVIENGVTNISGWAFFECSNLESVTIPNSVTSIGNYAFASCDSLASVDFGDNSQLQSIGERAFYSCDSLASITVDPYNRYYSSDECGVLFNQNKTTLIQYPIGNTRTSYSIPAS